MKKFITLLLVFVLSLSLFLGCKKKKPQTSESVPVVPQIPAGSTTNEGLANALSAQIKDASSMKFEFDVYNYLKSVSYYYTEDEDGNTVAETEEYYNESNREITATVSIGDDGKLDAKITSNEQIREYAGSGWETITVESYIIDNEVYAWNENIEAWIKQSAEGEDIAKLTQIIKEVKNGTLISQEDKQKLYAKLGEFINTSFSVKDYKGTVSIDGAPHFKNFLKYFENLDHKTKTLSSILDDGLKLIDSELNTQKLLAKVKEVASLTVNQALAKIDSWLTTNYQTTLQGIYDKVVSNETLVSMILDSMGVPTESREEVKARMKATKITDSVAQVGEVTLYNLLMGEIGSEEYPTIDELFAQIESMLALTVEQLEQSGDLPPFFTLLGELSKSLTVNRLDAKMDINFTDIFRIDSIDGEINVDMETAEPSEVTGETDKTSVKFNVSTKISEISNETKAISIPSDETVYDFYVSGYYEANEGELTDLYVWTEEEGAVVELYGYKPSGVSVSYRATIPTSALTNHRIELPIQNLETYVDYQLYTDTLDKSIIIEIDGDEFFVVQKPNLNIAEHSAYQALTMIENGETDFYTIDTDLGITVTMWVGSQTGQIFYNNPYPLSNIIFTYEIDNVTGEMVCKIVGYGTDGYLYDTETGIGYVGSEPKQIPTLFGGDLDFTFYVTEDGVVRCDDMPTVLPQYIKPQN